MIQLLTFHPVPTIRIVIALLPEHRHTVAPVIQQIIKGSTDVLPAEPLQVEAQPIREEPVGRQLFEGPHLLENQNQRRQQRPPPPEVAPGLTCVKSKLRSRWAEASLSCLKVEVKSARVSSISCTHERRSAQTRGDQRPSYLQQEGDEEAVLLFITQKSQFGSEQLADPESNGPFSDIARHLFPVNVRVYLRW